MYIMAVLASIDFSNTHFSVMNEKNTNYFVTENICEVWFNNEFIPGILKM